MSEVKRYVTTCDCMSEASWGEYVRHADYDALAAECERLREDRDSQQRECIKALAELAALKGGREAVAWYTEDHLTDKSATTYDKDVAARWSNKGWLVVELFTTPHAQASTWVPEGAVRSDTWLEEWARDKFTSTGRYKGDVYGNTDWALARALHSAMLAAAPTPGASDGK